MALEITGVRLVAENAQQAISSVNAFGKALDNLQKEAKDASKLKIELPAPKMDWLNKLAPSLDSAMNNITGKLPVIGQLSSSMGGLSSAIALVPPPLLAVAAAASVATVSFGAFLALGARGAALQPTVTAFGNLASQFGDSTQLLNKYRADTRGAISDMELMRTATFALSGASQELGNVLSQDLGKVLQNTRTLAESMGRDPAEAQGRFIEAIKKNERELLDELGIIVSADKAYEKYAKSINVASSSLTDQQKNTAFAMEAIAQLDSRVQALGGGTQSTLTNLAVPMTVIRNILDRLALAVQPAFAPLAQLVANVANAVQTAIQPFISMFASFMQIAGAAIQVALAIGNIGVSLIGLLPPVQLIGALLPYAAAGFSLLADAVSSVASLISNAAKGISDALASLGINLNTQTNSMVDSLASNMATGAGRIVGAFAGGLLRGGTMVVTAVTKIAQIVADFLQGFSPPKKGPLSRIDKGGQNIIEAWAKGFMAANLSPVDAVAQRVNDSLGEVASYSAEQVATRLSALDAALLPFNNQLAIAKSNMEAIAGFADVGIKAGERRLALALKQGSIDGAEVKQLDKQLGMLKELKAARQDEVDEAEMQLALAKSQQAQERALLTIRQSQVSATEQLAAAASGGGGGVGATDKAAKDAVEKAAKGAGGAAQTVQEAIAGGFSAGKPPDLLSSGAIDHAKEVLTTGFQSGLNDSGFNEALAGFSGGAGELQTQLARIREADPAKKLGEKFNDLATTLSKPFKTAQTTINGIISSIISKVQGIVAPIQAAMAGLQAVFTEFTTTLQNMVFIPLTLALNSLFGAGGLLGEGGQASLAITALFGEGGTLSVAMSSVSEMFNGLLTTVTDVISQIGSKFAGLQLILEVGKTGIEQIFTALKSTLTEWAGDVGLGQAANTIKTQLVDAFVNAVNSIISAFNNALGGISKPIRSVANFLGVDIGDLQVSQITANAQGALGFKGLSLVGEKGPELVNFSRPANIFPANLSRSIMSSFAPRLLK